MSSNELTFEDEEKFKSLVCRRLLDSGWVDEITLLCKEKLYNRLSDGQTLDSISENDLFNDLAPDARKKVPDTVKRELKVKVQDKLLRLAGYFDEGNTDAKHLN
ncbi:Hypothetical protein CINCED_3A012910 [Cinara cedri]|uniref:Enhancer of yellow 2 transcription factor homolog n=1 Tax=Cinara cedri TaxID=506608 RepID=A0A5E4LZR9_9HEMI|nr:Hypothetical protein CINCED_3A012910 [Cinara cedri]